MLRVLPYALLTHAPAVWVTGGTSSTVLFTLGTSRTASYLEIYFSGVFGLNARLHVVVGTNDNTFNPSGFTVGGMQFVAVSITGTTVTAYSGTSSAGPANSAWKAPTSNVQLSLALNDGFNGNFKGTVSDVQVMAVRCCARWRTDVSLH